MNGVTLDFSKAQPISQAPPSGDLGTSLDFSKAEPITPITLHGPVDVGRLGQALVHSNMLGTSPAFAYQQHDEIKKQLQEVGGDYWSDMGRAAETGVEETPLAMILRGRAPDPFESHDLLQNFVHDISGILSDPVFLGTAIGGSALGGPEVGIPLAFALDAGLRKSLMDHYQKGNVKSFGELADRAAATVWAGAKGAITGESAVLAGGLPVPGAIAGSTLARFGVHALYQSAALTTVGSLLDWRVPKMEDFTRTAAVITGLGLLTLPSEIGRAKAQRALMDVYAKDGTPPAEAAARLQAQPTVEPEQAPGLRPAIRITRPDGSKGIITADEGETHPDLAERMGQRPVTMDELEKDQVLADKVLKQPEIHLQQVIDRAAEIKREQGVEVPDRSKLESGRGFTSPDGKFLSRGTARVWVKDNEPEVYDMWATVTGDKTAEFHSDDYTQARERVRNRALAQGSLDFAGASPLSVRRLAAVRETLNKIKAGIADSKYGETLRGFLFGQRDMRRVEANNVSENVRRLLPDYVDREALSFMRDYKEHPEELKAERDAIVMGKDVELKKLVPAMERALNPSPQIMEADKLATDYFTRTLDEGRELDFLESGIPPERYITHVLMETAKEGEEARPLGRPVVATRTPYAIQRKYPTILDALKTGKIEARTLDAADAINIYGDRHATVAATRLFINELKESELGKWGTQKSVPVGWKTLSPGNRVFEHHIISAETGEGFSQSFHVPKVIADAMSKSLEPGTLRGITAFRTARVMQAYIKAAELGLSVFHMKALSITAMNNMTFGDLVRALKSDMSSADFQAKEREMAADTLTTPRSQPPYEAYRGLQPSSLTQEGWRKVMDEVRGVTPIRQLDQVAGWLTYETFDVIQRKFKVMDASLKEAAWAAKHPRATDEEYFAARRSIAKEVNAAYGGLNWEAMGWSKNGVELARGILLAPDWTFSNVLNLKYAFEGGAAGRAARAFWIKSFATGLALNQAASVLISGQLSKQPTNVYLGKDPEGKEMYANWFFAGAPKDFITWINNLHDYGAVVGTAQTIGNKLGPLLGTYEQLKSNRDWTGREIVKRGEGPVAGTLHGAEAAAGRLLPIPFWMTDIERLLTDDKPHSYWDYVSVLGASYVRHVTPGGTPARAGKFHIPGVSRSRKALAQ